ncbi:hypothetical protein HPB49_021424 [Dermacentor silvarum]|uniref:Uncharacterized protein n=1 Tax=Dermacentor silvarum TaxID=543639 RepID=A0ACB8C5S4_DERSI|nr:hypothetical protein HPB49_021424 [Dermacentor silvarum]
MERRRKLAAAQLLLIIRRRQALSRRQWVRPVWTKRADESEYFTANGDDSLFFKFYRMSPETFDALHDLVRDRLSKEWVCRDPISSGERLALTLRYLSSGMLIRDAAMAFRVGLETAREAIHLTCSVLWEVLSPVYMKPPTEDDWRDIAAGFCSRWQFPNCLGAVDGKHVEIRCPRKAGSLYFNYKGTHSIVLMAVADSQYLFRLIDVGAPGRRCVEKAFGILVSRWRIYERQINLQPENADSVVKATCILHNFLSMTANAAATYRPPGYADCHDVFGSVHNGTWRQGTASAAVFGLQGAKARNSTNVANSVQKVFMNYFKNEGQVAWQWDLPRVTRP